MNRKKILQIIKSPWFQKTTAILGLVFMILTGVIIIDPTPFLRFSYLGIFVFNMFGGSGMFLIPTLVGKSFHPILIAAASAAGMGLNDTVSWFIGSFGHKYIPHSPKVRRIEEVITKFGVIALFIWSMIPFPYDLIGLISGYLGFSYKKFIIPTFLGKFIRFTLIGYGIHLVFG